MTMVLEHAKTRPNILKYLPDPDDKGLIPIDRAFLFDLVNTREPDYFPEQLRRIEQEKHEV